MRGSIVARRDARGRDRYWVVIEETTAQGRRRRRWHADPATGSAFTSKRAAENHAAALVASVAAGGYVAPSRLLLGDWLDTWLATIRPSLKPATWASYEKNLRLHVKPDLGTQQIRRITPLALDRLYTQLLATGRTDGRGGLSPRTVHYIASILKAALADAVRKGLLARNPADAADPPRPGSSSGQIHAWSASELATFLTATSDHPYAPVWAFLAATGARRGEALGLRWTDLATGPDGRTHASLVQTIQKVRGRLLVGTTKTAASRRVVVLDPGTTTLLVRHRANQASWRQAWGPAWASGDLVFTRHDGTPLYPETISRAFREQVTRLGLPPLTLHGLRHTWATLALQAGIHPKIVQERLGHANVAITLGIYSHVAPTMHANAADLVAALVHDASPRALGR